MFNCKLLHLIISIYMLQQFREFREFMNLLKFQERDSRVYQRTEYWMVNIIVTQIWVRNTSC